MPLAITPGVALVLLLPLAGEELTRAQKEEFLRTAEVVRTRETSKGVAGVLRATLRSRDGSITHDAAIARIDVRQKEFRGDRDYEINFRDTYKFNIAAYKLALLLGLDMVPATVERSYGGSSGSFCWWVDGVLMDEGERQRKKVTAPDESVFNAQYFIVQIFDELIYNVDRNQGNLLITRDWQLWMIDHGRAFRLHRTLRRPEVLKMCERDLFARLQALDRASLDREIGQYTTTEERKALLARRDLIVQYFRKAGEKAFYTYAARRCE